MVRWPGRIEAGQVSDHLGYFPDIMPTLADLAGLPFPATSDGVSIAPTLLGNPSEQNQHEFLYWEDPQARAVRLGRWKAIQPQLDAAWQLYQLEHDIEEKHDVARHHPEFLQRLIALADSARSPEQRGEVYDATVGFDGHTDPK